MIDQAEEYIWKGENNTNRSPMVLAGHSMAGFNMRIFNSRNPNLVKAIVFADPVNPDFILYPKFGGRYRNNPIYNFGSFFLAPTGIQYLFMTLSSLGSHSDPGEQTKRARLFICFFFFSLACRWRVYILLYGFIHY